MLVGLSHGLGILLYAGAVALGAAELQSAYPQIFNALQIIGLVFLAYLGLNMLRGGWRGSTRTICGTNCTTPSQHPLGFAADGFLIVFFNPKNSDFLFCYFQPISNHRFKSYHPIHNGESGRRNRRPLVLRHRSANLVALHTNTIAGIRLATGHRLWYCVVGHHVAVDLRPSASTDQASQTLGQNIYWPIIKNDLVGPPGLEPGTNGFTLSPSFGGVRTISSPSPVIALTTITSLGCGTL